MKDSIEIDALIDRIPRHYICQKRLWAGVGDNYDTYVDINHIDNDLDKPLNYLEAFKKMVKELEV